MIEGNRAAVVVGRFQNYLLHEGYRRLFDQVDKDDYTQLVVVLGESYKKGTEVDPLSFEVRSRLLSEHLNLYNRPYTIVSAHDRKCNDDWSDRLDILMESSTGGKPFDIIVGRDSFRKHYTGKYKDNFVQVDEVSDINSTSNRENLMNIRLHEYETQFVNAFAQGAIWQSQRPYPRIDVTVDCAVIVTDREEPFILLGKKPGESQWRLPGGFVDPTDAMFEDAASRELLEETTVSIPPSKWEYVMSADIKDWRYRSGRDTSRTILFATTVEGYVVEDFKASDDLQSVILIELRNATNIVAEHKVLIDALKDRYLK